MLITYSEKNEFVFEGTIIDLETIGDFCNYNDSRYYHKIIPIILGYINKDELKIVCAKGEEAIAELKKQSSEIIRNLERPFFWLQLLF
jgi:hypothetical protein